MNSLLPVRRHAYPLSLLIVFIAVHGAFYYFGGRFDTLTHNFWQVIDGELLRDRLWESLWYLHIQPPLFNAYLGVVQAIPWIEPAWIYYLTYLTLGFAAAFSLFYLICGFRVYPGIAVGAVALCLLSPSWILYEHWLFYEFPTMALLALAAFQIQRLLKNTTVWNSFWVFSILALLFLLRSIFHWVWYAATFFILLAAAPKAYKSLLKGAAAPTLLIVLFLIKNYLVFGVCSTSTWLGPNLLMMTRYIPYSVRDRLYEEGKFSPVSAVKPFAHLEEFEAWIPNVLKQTWGVPILDATQRSDGAYNYNHCAYLSVNRYQLQDAKAMIARSPWKYLKQVRVSYRRFCYPAWNNAFFHEPHRLKSWLTIWKRIFLGWNQQDVAKNFDEMRVSPKKHFLYWFFPFWMVVSITLLFLPERITALDRNDRLLLAFCFMSTFLIIFGGTFLLAAENNRIRFLLTPFWATYSALIVDRYAIPNLRWLISKMKRGGARTSCPHDL
jgi:hypothetical protein